MADFVLGVKSHWGFGIRVREGARIFILAELFAGIPIYGETSYPSGVVEKYDRWTLGVGASAVLELLMGPVFARIHANLGRQGEARFLYSEDSTGLEGMFTSAIGFGLELGVRL